MRWCCLVLGVNHLEQVFKYHHLKTGSTRVSFEDESDARGGITFPAKETLKVRA